MPESKQNHMTLRLLTKVANMATCVGGLEKALEEAFQEREAMAVELAALRADAERARWCETHGADVVYSDIEKLWWVLSLDEHGLFRETSHPDRNAAIDAARGAK
jgi:hypothetical protein